MRLVFAALCMVVAAASVAATAQLMQPVLDDVFLSRDRAMLMVLPWAVFLVFLARGLSEYGHMILLQVVRLRVAADMRRRLFDRLMRGDLAFFHRHASGRLTSRFIADIELMSSSLSQSLLMIVKEALTLVFLLAVAFYHDATLTLLCALAFLLLARPVVVVGRRVRGVSRRYQGSLGALSAHLEQVFQGMRYVKAYGMERAESGRVAEIVGKAFHDARRIEKLRTLLRPLIDAMGGVMAGAAVFYGGHRVLDGGLTPGAFTAFVTALLLAYKPAKSLANVNVYIQQGLGAGQRIFDVMDMEPRIRDRADAVALCDEGAGYEVRFADVSFSYDGKRKALDGVNLEVPGRATVALVGASGSGKSTLLNLIPRFYDIDAGCVMVGGVDVRALRLSSLRSKIALVSQEVSVFDGTVRENIAYGKPLASMAEIKDAAREAYAHDFIRRLPQGYETMVGEHGVKLSGGQRQRLSIARAVLRDAPLLLLDEATSALDNESERKVQEALERLRRRRTTIIVAHRLTTIMGADTIHVLNDGRIQETGAHERLLAAGGVYARLYHKDSAGLKRRRAGVVGG